jgi:hypothetical protein
MNDKYSIIVALFEWYIYFRDILWWYKISLSLLEIHVAFCFSKRKKFSDVMSFCLSNGIFYRDITQKRLDDITQVWVQVRIRVKAISIKTHRRVYCQFEPHKTREIILYCCCAWRYPVYSKIFYLDDCKWFVKILLPYGFDGISGELQIHTKLKHQKFVCLCDVIISAFLLYISKGCRRFLLEFICLHCLLVQAQFWAMLCDLSPLKKESNTWMKWV